MSESNDKREKGLDILRQMGWSEKPQVDNMDDEFWDFTLENLFGTVWARPGMSLRDRELVTLATLIAQDRTQGLIPHMNNAHKLGISLTELRELIYQVMFYAGWSVGAHATIALNQAIAQGTIPEEEE